MPLRQYKPVEFEIDPPKYEASDADFVLPEDGVSNDLRDKLEIAGAGVVQEDKDVLRIQVKKSKAREKLSKNFSDGATPECMEGFESSRPAFVHTRLVLTKTITGACHPARMGRCGGCWMATSSNDSLLGLTLDHCLERMTSFGRAESFTPLSNALQPMRQNRTAL